MCFLKSDNIQLLGNISRFMMATKENLELVVVKPIFPLGLPFAKA